MKAVIFDMDGILLDSEKANIDSIKHAAETLGHQPTDEQTKLFAGRNPKDCIKHIDENIDKEKFLAAYKEKNDELYPLAEIFEETVVFIKTLKQNNIKTALCTSGNRASVDVVLKRTNIEFDAIITFEDVEKRKPHPEPYLIAAKKLNKDPKDCIVFEDTDIGVESAKAAGMKCIAVPTDATKHQDFSHADLILDKIENNLKLLRL